MIHLLTALRLHHTYTHTRPCWHDTEGTRETAVSHQRKQASYRMPGAALTRNVEKKPGCFQAIPLARVWVHPRHFFPLPPVAGVWWVCGGRLESPSAPSCPPLSPTYRYYKCLVVESPRSAPSSPCRALLVAAVCCGVFCYRRRRRDWRLLSEREGESTQILPTAVIVPASATLRYVRAEKREGIYHIRHGIDGWGHLLPPL